MLHVPHNHPICEGERRVGAILSRKRHVLLFDSSRFTLRFDLYLPETSEKKHVFLWNSWVPSTNQLKVRNFSVEYLISFASAVCASASNCKNMCTCVQGWVCDFEASVTDVTTGGRGCKTPCVTGRCIYGWFLRGEEVGLFWFIMNADCEWRLLWMMIVNADFEWWS